MVAMDCHNALTVPREGKMRVQHWEENKIQARVKNWSRSAD